MQAEPVVQRRLEWQAAAALGGDLAVAQAREQLAEAVVADLVLVLVVLLPLLEHLVRVRVRVRVRARVGVGVRVGARVTVRSGGGSVSRRAPSSASCCAVG